MAHLPPSAKADRVPVLKDPKYLNPFDPQNDDTDDSTVLSDDDDTDALPPPAIVAKDSFFSNLATAVSLNGEQGLRYAMDAIQQLPDLYDAFCAAVRSAAVLQMVDGSLPGCQIWLRMHIVQHVTEHVLHDKSLMSVLNDEARGVNFTKMVSQWDAHWEEMVEASRGLESDPEAIHRLSLVVNTCGKVLHRVAREIAAIGEAAEPNRFRPMNFFEAVGVWPFACLTLLGLSIAALVQAVLGFVVYNWPKAFGDIQWKIALAGFIITIVAILVHALSLVVLQMRNVNNAKTWNWLKRTLPAAEAATRRLVIEARPGDQSLAMGGEDSGWRPSATTMMPIRAAGTDLTLKCSNGDCFTDLAALMKTTPVICVDRGLVVTYFNEAAEELTGFTRADAVGRHISAIVVEQSLSHIASSVSAALSSRAIYTSAQFITIVSVEHYLVQLQFTYSCLTASQRDGAPAIGVALIGRQVFDLEKTNEVYLVRYRHAELNAELPNLRRSIEANDRQATSWYLDRSFKIVEGSSWSNISVAAHQMKQWKALATTSILDTISRNHMNITDLKFSKNLPDFIECDAEGICMIISELLQNLVKRCTVTVGSKNFDASYSGLTFHLAPLIYDTSAAHPLNSPLLESLLVNSGASLSVVSENEVLLCCPHLPVSDGDDTSTSFRNMGQKKKLPEGKDSGAAAAAHTFNFLLFEPNSIFKHTVSMAVWALGHSVTSVESVASVERFVGGPGAKQVHCALIDAHSPLAVVMVREIQKRDEKVHIVVLREGNSHFDPELNSLPVTTKPLKRAALEELTLTLVGQEDERNKQQKFLEEQRKILSAHRSAPWHRGKKLGQGAFADVYVATSELTGAQMAVKIIYLDRLSGNQEALVNEIGIMCKLSHPNIVHYFYCEEGDRTVNLFMELCDASLQIRMRENGRPFTKDEAVEIMRQVLLAVDYLHSLELVHRDIKPGNVLIGRDGKFKLADFGTATKARDDLVSTAGTFRYMAPEVFAGQQYGRACDIWSVGILYLDLLGKLPPPGFVAMPALVDDLDADSVTLPTGLDDQTFSFLSLCLQMDQTQRPSAATLLHHPFFQVDAAPAVPLFSKASGGAHAATQAAVAVQEQPAADLSEDESDDSDMLIPGLG